MQDRVADKAANKDSKLIKIEAVVIPQSFKLDYCWSNNL
jgi:hypothetical protein